MPGTGCTLKDYLSSHTQPPGGPGRASGDVCCYKTGPSPRVMSSQGPHTAVGKETDLERLRTYEITTYLQLVSDKGEF